MGRADLDTGGGIPKGFRNAANNSLEFPLENKGREGKKEVTVTGIWEGY
mgnify:CR=1 FL=1